MKIKCVRDTATMIVCPCPGLWLSGQSSLLHHCQNPEFIWDTKLLTSQDISPRRLCARGRGKDVTESRKVLERGLHREGSSFRPPFRMRS